MGIRERTKLVKLRKRRRCAKCGRLLGLKLKRCKSCHVKVPAR